MRPGGALLTAGLVLAPLAVLAAFAAGESAGPRAPATALLRSTTAHHHAPVTSSGFAHPSDGVALPDGFVPHTLRPGERPPVFVVVSFDGAGWHQQWEHWLDVAGRVPFRFTGFLSGTYLLSDRTRDRYHPPHYPPGTSEIGWNDPAAVVTEIDDLNRAVRAGMEIGTHFNGHFCASGGLPSGGDTWTTADWDQELDQFFARLRDYRSDNGLPSTTRLLLGPADITGERTPCLEGRRAALFPALRSHGLRYDSSFTRPVGTWPTRDEQYDVWQVGMVTQPLHGTGHPVTTMDYNYFFTQHGASDAGVTPAESRRDSRQVLATYRDLYRAALAGNRAPLILGNHFNDWNHDAYRDALTRFVLETCGRPETECVPFRDLVAWLDVQTPGTLTTSGSAPRRSVGVGAGLPGSPAGTAQRLGRTP